MVVMLSACGGSSVDTIDSKTVERDSIASNSKPKSLFYWTHDTIIQVNEPLVKLMDSLYQHICSDSFKIKNIGQNLKWMADFRKQLCRYYDKNSLLQDSISQYVKADSVIAEARRLWKVDEDTDTGLLVSFLDDSGKTTMPIKGSFSALNCYYLTLIAPDFATGQYTKMKTNFAQNFPLSGIREYHNRTCCAGIDVDAGPIILNLSPSGTAFAIGSATYFNDMESRNKLLKTCEIAGHTVEWNNHRHYLLSNVALVGEAITLAMRTNTLIHN